MFHHVFDNRVKKLYTYICATNFGGCVHAFVGARYKIRLKLIATGELNSKQFNKKPNEINEPIYWPIDRSCLPAPPPTVVNHEKPLMMNIFRPKFIFRFIFETIGRVGEWNSFLCKYDNSPRRMSRFKCKFGAIKLI